MPWIADVVPQTTIRSVWGNQIRDRTVMQLTSVADRDAYPAGKLVDGMVCYTAAERTWWRRRDGVWWPSTPYKAFVPKVWLSPQPGGNWMLIPAGNVTTAVAEYRRDFDMVDYVVRVTIAGYPVGTGPVAVSLPFDPWPYAVRAVGAASLTDNQYGTQAGGAAVFLGPLTGIPVAGPPGVLTQPTPTGVIDMTCHYRCNDQRDTSPYG